MVILPFHHSHFCTHGLKTWLAVIYTPHKLQFWSILDIRYEFKCKDRYLMHMPPSGCSPAYWASGGLCFNSSNSSRHSRVHVCTVRISCY
ncbi:hypothetical protein I7I50_11824 [Histoplasma capsulatum G186AR]|uniref:Uncharacterized protein n=1 Tax=Ajellomyces capsulatus TaxID=5037 RepID=A0A8H7Z643_AJECA|nr:hypothetical protein I7I52_03062 [Histoplasma capsulatum]QSS70255.1 hypothetical protein I7I50_11824 [Histoplasma capsulatum G186AR]